MFWRNPRGVVEHRPQDVYGSGFKQRSWGQAGGSGGEQRLDWARTSRRPVWGSAALKNAFEPCSSSSRRGSAKASPWSARILANTKAAYRFLSNERVSEAAILAGHFQSTRARCLAEPQPVLILHDTTEFSFKREDIGPIGMCKVANYLRIWAAPRKLSANGSTLWFLATFGEAGVRLGLSPRMERLSSSRRDPTRLRLLGYFHQKWPRTLMRFHSHPMRF